MALNIPLDEIGGDQQIVGVYATTSRRRVRILGPDGDANSVDFVQVARQGNPLFNEGLVAIKDKDLYSRTSPECRRQPVPQVRGDAGAGGAHQRARLRIERGADDEPHRHRGHLHPRPDQGGPLDRAGAARRRRRRAIRPIRTTPASRASASSAATRSSARCRPASASGTVPGGWPNGRRFGDDVLDIAVTALISDLRVSPPIIVGPAGDNVDKQRHRLQQGVPVRGDAAERSHAHALGRDSSRPSADPTPVGSARPARAGVAIPGTLAPPQEGTGPCTTVRGHQQYGDGRASSRRRQSCRSSSRRSRAGSAARSPRANGATMPAGRTAPGSSPPRRSPRATSGTLQVAWTYPDGDTDFNPLVVRDVIYTRARGNTLVAIDAATGKQRWASPEIKGFAIRGVNYWESADGKRPPAAAQHAEHAAGLRRQHRPAHSRLRQGRRGRSAGRARPRSGEGRAAEPPARARSSRT